MFGSLSIRVDRLPLGRWCSLAVLVACLGIPGCSSPNLRGEGFRDNELSNLARQMRQADEMAQSHAFSNKARQIDQSLGGSRKVTPSESLLAP